MAERTAPLPGIQVEVVVAWPRRHAARQVRLPVGATVGDAVVATGFDAAMLAGVTAFAVHGERVQRDHPLGDGDRVELLRPLLADPKASRRARAERQRRAPGINPGG